MSVIDSYEKFCKAFKGNPDEVKRAELLLFIQDWIIRIIDKIDEDGADYSFDALIADNSDKAHLRSAKKDAVSRLVDDSDEASRRISENMRENIVRENVRMPVYKVREVNNYGLNWLSRRPGSTIKEKISSAHASIMAVQRRMSLDTGENRLYVAYLKELSELLQSKLEHFPESQLRKEEESFYTQIFSIIRDPHMDEIRRWENMPPNNTLLSDQNYKKIWRCWNELKQLDDLILADDAEIASRICTIFYVEFLTRASGFFCFPQAPVVVDYASYAVELYADGFCGFDENGDVLEIERGENRIDFAYRGAAVGVAFTETALRLTVNGRQERETDIHAGSLYKLVELVLTRLGARKNKRQKTDEPVKAEKRAEKYDAVIMDLFALRPRFLYNDGQKSILKGRLLNQSHIAVRGDGPYTFEIACDKAKAVILREGIESSFVASAVDNASGFQMSKIMHLLEQYISAPQFTWIFPDIYNEFQLSLVHKSARLVFQEVESFPRSLGAAFFYMDSGSFEKTFSRGDFLLVLDIVDFDLSITLIQSLEDKTVADDIPEYGGVIWERHPSLSYSMEKEIQNEIIDKLLEMGCANPEYVYSLLGLAGFQTEAGLLSFVTEGGPAFRISQSVYRAMQAVRMNITDKINGFIGDHRGVIGNRRVHIVSLAPQLLYKGTSSFEVFDYEQALEGCYLYKRLQPRSDTILWRDHLPELAIKLLHGKFNLVDNETVTPEFNVEKRIQIDTIFTLAKNNMGEYHFDLVQKDVNRKTRYAAVVKNPAFPVKEEVPCRLDLTYRYGAEEPYRLLFIPVDKEAAGFVEAKVSWEKAKEYPYMELDYPEAISTREWSEMRDFTGKNGSVDLIEELSKRLRAIGEGYQTVDIRQFDISFRGEEGKRLFSLPAALDGEPVNIIFAETNVDKQKNVRPVSFDHLGVISFDIREASNRGKRRYELDLEACFGNRSIWVNKGHGYASYPYLLMDGNSVKVALFESEFDHPEDFHPGITRVSFEVVPYKDIFKAIKIHDEDAKEPYEERKNYFAVNIRKGSVPGQFTYNAWMYFIMHSIFTGNHSFYDKECPAELRDAFEYARDSWIDMFYSCDDDYVKMRIFNLMSLVAEDVGSDYFEIAQSYLEDYRNNAGKLPGYIGYALGDCTKTDQLHLFDQILKLEPEKTVCILSKAIWGREDYIWNVPVAKTLEYFEIAIGYLRELCRKANPDEKEITMCLEYILGVFRLRKYKDRDLNYRLSMNSLPVRELYDIIEQMIDQGMEPHSFLDLKIQNKGMFEEIPDLLYAMLVYITGEKGAGDIKISGLDSKHVDI